MSLHTLITSAATTALRLAPALALALPATGDTGTDPLADNSLASGGETSEARITTTLFEELEQAARRSRPESFFELKVEGSAQQSTDIDAGGSLSTQRGGWSARFGRRSQGVALFSMELEAEASFYNFGGGPDLVPGSSNPFNDLYRTRVEIGSRTAPGLGLGYFSAFEVALGAEDDANPTDGLVVGGAGGLSLQPDQGLSVTLGLAAQSRLEDSACVWPFLGFEWQASERLSVSAHGPRPSSIDSFGPQVRVGYELSEAWTCFFDADYRLRQFRLNEDNPLADGALHDEEIRLGVGLERDAGKGLRLELTTGLSAWRELGFYDSRGASINEVELDPGLYVGLVLTGSF